MLRSLPTRDRVSFDQAVLSHAEHQCELPPSGDIATSRFGDQASASIHDFREFSGLTPTAYGAGRTAFQNHVTFLQSDAG